MPITQDRIRDLLEEFETTISAIQAALRNAAAITTSETLSGIEKADLLLGELNTLRNLPRFHALVERRDLNRNWKRNQRAADKSRQRRRERGVPERGKPTDSDWIPRAGVTEQYIADDGYDAFNRDGAQPRTISADDFRPVTQLLPENEIYLCMHEMGLADKPTTAQLAKWREEREERRKADGHGF